MSRHETNGQQTYRSEDAQLAYLTLEYGLRADAAEIDTVTKRAHTLELHFSTAELRIIAALDTPQKVQDFLDVEIYYNDDHGPNAKWDETVFSPKQVLHKQLAHCFEATLFAYTVLYLHGYDPKFCLIEASNDYDHCIVVVADKAVGGLRSITHSRHEGMNGHAGPYETLEELMRSYKPYYYNFDEDNGGKLTMVGYSEPIDLVAKFGTLWMDRETELWDIYCLVIDDTVTFHHVDDDTATHPYPMVRAIQEGWIGPNGDGNIAVHTHRFPEPMQTVWNTYHALPEEAKANGVGAAIEAEFVRMAGMTPRDLITNASEAQTIANHGFSPNTLLSGTKTPDNACRTPRSGQIYNKPNRQ